MDVFNTGFSDKQVKAIMIAEELGWELMLNKHIENLIYLNKENIFSISLNKNDIVHCIEQEIETKTSKRYISIYGWDDYSEIYIRHLRELLERLKNELYN